MSKLTINSKLPMNSGYDIPVLGFGVFLVGSGTECEDAVTAAIKAGYRHIDSAVYYQNEASCGAAIRKSSVPREELFFTSKIQPGGLGYESSKASVKETLKKTGLDYVDLMLIHAPYGGREKRKGTWKALVEAVEEGKIRSIGVSNYGVHHLDELEEIIAELETERGGKGKGGVISVGQWELHPWLTRPDIVEWSKKRNVVVQAYCPVVRGKKANDPTLNKLAAKYGKSWAQVLLRWSLQSGFVPLPKSTTPSRIIENAEIYDFDLTPEDMKVLTTTEYSPITWDPTVSGLEDSI